MKKIIQTAMVCVALAFSMTARGQGAAEGVDFRTSRTAQNLLKAFAGESQARNRYAFAAEKARDEGFDYIANVFEATAVNEHEHAEIFFSHLSPLAPGALEIQAEYPIVAGGLKAQLKAAMEGELEEWEVLYAEFAETAKEEGFEDIANSFKLIGYIEKEHAQRFERLLERVKNGTVFTREEPIRWRCMDCGHIHEGTSAPDVCPVCNHAISRREPVGENF